MAQVGYFMLIGRVARGGYQELDLGGDKRRRIAHVELLLHRIVSVVPLSKLQTTSFLHVPYIVHQKEYKVCWFWMMTPDAGLKSTPSISKPSEEDAQPHDDERRRNIVHSEQKYETAQSTHLTVTRL